MANYRFSFQQPSDAAALARFAARLSQTEFGSWPLDAAWGQKLPGASVDDDFPVRRRRLLLCEGDEVRAFHNFFEHEIYLNGRPHRFVWPNGPLSEGIVNPRYAMSWPMLLAHSLKLNPLHLWMGGPTPVHAMLERMGWKRTSPLPRFLLPLRPGKILREMDWFQRSPGRALVARMLRTTGLGHAIAFLASGWKRLTGSRSGMHVEEWDHFGDWADRLWHRVQGQYAAVVRRDAATMNRLYRPQDRRFRRFLIRKGDREIGWFLATTRLLPTSELNLGFGSLRVGVLVDTFAEPEDARDLMRHAVATMIADDVDLVFGHWSHHAWQRACKDVGFLRQCRNYPLFVSPAGRDLLFTEGCPLEAVHFTESDNDGPYYIAPDEAPISQEPGRSAKRHAGVVKSAEVCFPVSGAEVVARNVHGAALASTQTSALGQWRLSLSEPAAIFQFTKPGFVTKTVAAEQISPCVRLLEERLIGFQPRLWARPGDVVHVFVQAPSVFRAGLYRHGQSRVRVLDLGEHPPQAQEVPDGPFVASGLQWKPSLSYRVPEEVRPGLYSVLLRAQGQEDFAIPLVVSTPPLAQGLRSKVLVLACTNDWLAYNFWGGRSRYRNWEGTLATDGPPFSPSAFFHLKQKIKGLLPPSLVPRMRRWLGKPDPNRAADWQLQTLSLRRPFTCCGLEQEGPNQPFNNHLAAGEWRLLAWLEREGYEYDIVSGYELHCRPELLEQYRVLILNTHAEYWSKKMYEGLRHFHEQQKGWVLNLSGNSIYREVAFEEDGSHRCVSLSFADSCSDETQVLGVRFSMNDFGSCAPYRILQPAHWAFTGIPIAQSQLFGGLSLNQNMPRRIGTSEPARSHEVHPLDGCGASGWETDKLSQTAPQDLVVLARGTNRFGGADMVIRDPSGTRGGMFSASSLVFSGCLLIDSTASLLVQNVLQRALEGTRRIAELDTMSRGRSAA